MSLNELSENGFQGKMRTAVIEKVQYNGPISIANLFSDSNVKYTLNHIFASFIDKTNEARRDGIEFEEPVVFYEKMNLFHVEYTFITDCLAELVDDGISLMRDFAINYDDTKNAEFLVASVMEDMLGLVKVNNKKMQAKGKSEITYRASFMKPLILDYLHYVDESERVIQMNAVSFTANSLQNNLNADIFRHLKYVCSESTFKVRQGVFGRKACADFWKNEGNNPKYFTLVK